MTVREVFVQTSFLERKEEKVRAKRGGSKRENKHPSDIKQKHLHSAYIHMHVNPPTHTHKKGSKKKRTIQSASSEIFHSLSNIPI